MKQLQVQPLTEEEIFLRMKREQKFRSKISADPRLVEKTKAIEQEGILKWKAKLPMVIYQTLDNGLSIKFVANSLTETLFITRFSAALKESTCPATYLILPPAILRKKGSRVIGVVSGGLRGLAPPMEMLPIIKMSQKRLMFFQFQLLLASSRTTVHAYNSN